MKNIELDELKAKFEKNEVTLVEVLDQEKYKQSHIKKAVNVPLESINQDTQNRFLRDEPLVVYCTDTNCTASQKAAEKLDELGFTNVYRYQGGKKEWKEAGLPMAGESEEE